MSGLSADETTVEVVVEDQIANDESAEFQRILAKIENEKLKARARAERFGLIFSEEDFKPSVVLTKEEYKLFCSEGKIIPPSKSDPATEMSRKKAFELRDREYTQKLLEKVASETRLARERAERFGLAFTEPRMDVLLTPEEYRKFMSATAGRNPLSAETAPIAGIDTLCEEEQERQRQRAERFADAAADVAAAAAADAEATAAAEAARAAEEERVAEVARREARAAKYGLAVDDAPYGEDLRAVFCCPRREAEAEAEALEETLHCYGVDRLSTAEILDYFKAYGPAYVLWLDDSSGNVVFADSSNARRAYHSLGQTIRLPPPAPADPTLDAAAGSLGTGGGGPGWVADAVWRRGPDYTKDGKTYPVLIRFATTRDVKAGQPPAKSKRLWLAPAARVRGGGGGGKAVAVARGARRASGTRSVSVQAAAPAAQLDIADLRSTIGKARKAREPTARTHPYAPPVVMEDDAAPDAMEAEQALAQPGPWVLTADDERVLQSAMEAADDDMLE